jgi:hypothetical protein
MHPNEVVLHFALYGGGRIMGGKKNLGRDVEWMFYSRAREGLRGVEKS